MTLDPPILSVVATSRNDDHGKNLLYRMQQFVDGFIEQCKRHDLKAELILVEWNPLENKLPLSQALRFPKDKGPCTVRIIRVPHEVHMQLDHADNIPLFQMIGKNVGIRRATGQFVLATNIDIIFSDALIQYLKTRLKPGRLYRVDRLDIPESLPVSTNYDDILSFCSHNIHRINAKAGTILLNKISFRRKLFFIRSSIARRLKVFYKKIRKATPLSYLTRSIPFIFGLFHIPVSLTREEIKRAFCTLYPSNPFIPHTNACGDFTLLSSQDWANLKGYPEWNKYSWHIDSVLVHQARQHGIKEWDLPRKMPIYHIEHEAGSGYSPENAHLLFKRLDDRGIPYLTDSALKELVSQMKNSKEKVVYNNENWGMAHLSLEELLV